MKKEVLYKETFVKRLENQLVFIAEDDPVTADKFKNDLLMRLKSIPDNPHLCRKSIYFDDEAIRDLIFKGYTIVFRISDNAIEIFGLVYNQLKPTD